MFPIPKVGDKYVFEVYVNGEKIASVKDCGKGHKDSSSVDVYIPASWSRVADGYVKDFVISSAGMFLFFFNDFHPFRYSHQFMADSIF